MTISMMTVLTRLLFNSLILILQFILLKYLNKRQYIHSRLLVLLNVAFIISLTLPIEFGFTIEIPSKNILPFLILIVNTPLFSLASYSITLLHLLLITWLVGTLNKIYRLLTTYRKLLHSITPLAKHTIQLPYQQKKIAAKLVLIEGLDSPAVIGLLRPIIILPKQKWNAQELAFILAHETFHIANLDLYLKYYYELLVAIYWWNPLVYLFRTQMNHILELRVDEDVVANFSDTEKIAYVETLVKISKQLKSPAKINPFRFSFTTKNRQLLLQRSKNIFESSNQRLSKGLSLLLLLSCYYLSTAIVFEPAFPLKTSANFPFEISLNNSYLRKQKKESYQLYVNNHYITTIDHLDDQPVLKKLPIID